MNNWTLIIFVLLLGKVVACASDIKTAQHLFFLINEFNAEEKFVGANIDYKIIKRETDIDSEHKNSVIFWADNACLRFNKAGLPFGFMNYNVKNNIEIKEGPIANWSKDQADKTILRFISKVVPNLLDQIKLDKISFEKVLHTSGTSIWKCYYNRVSQDGYFYESDYLSVLISEKKGVRSYFAHFYSLPRKFGKPKISQENALLNAAVELSKLVEYPPVAGKFKGYKFENTPLRVELKVVNANYLRIKYPPPIAFEKEFEGDCRLAWVVKYRAVGKETYQDAILSPMELSVWVDALSGEIVGARY